MLELLQPGGVDVPLMNLTAYLGRQAHRPTTTTTTTATAPPPPLHPSLADQEGVGVGERATSLSGEGAAYLPMHKQVDPIVLTSLSSPTTQKGSRQLWRNHVEERQGAG
jgi:hypothetical protein